MTGPRDPLRHGLQFLSGAVPSRGESRLALGLVLLLGVAFASAVPFAHVPGNRIAAFMPAYEAALFLCDLMTAGLLLGQGRLARSRALLVLGGGYLFDALMILAHAASFPGLFAESGLFGAGEQTTIWLYVFWHTGFPCFVLAYALLRRRESLPEPVRAAPRPQAAIAAMAGLAVALALGCTLLAFPGQDWLPMLAHGNDRARVLTTGIGPLAWAVAILAWVAVSLRRRRSVLDLWLGVVMWAWVLDMGLAIVIGTSRFDLSFYISRGFGLFAATAVLLALLLEMNRLYASLAGALDLAEARNLELVRSREELARVQRMEAVGQLTGGVAHDFNNLLQAVSANLELIGKVPGVPARVLTLAGRALRGTARGARITEQLLTFSRRHISFPVPTDLNLLLADIAPLLRQAASPCELMLRLSDGAAPARLDRAQFEAALLNLIANAREAQPEGGPVIVATTRASFAASTADGLEAGAYTLVTVEDAGEGMEEAVRARAFEPFFTTRPVGHGSGLGLSQVYGFVTGAGGQVSIDSAPGDGTRVRLYFPAVELPRPDPAAPPRPSPASPVPTVRDYGTVLVVEDDPDVLEVTALRLADLGYRAVLAHDAAEALEALQREAVDLLFADVLLPGGMSGAELAAQARRDRPGLHVLLTSGYLRGGTDHDGELAEAAVLRKPYSQEDLAIWLRRALRG